MGFGRRVVRKSVRRMTPRPVRKAMHPARAVRNAVTPQPVKQASRGAYTVRHPVGAAENKAIGAILYPPRSRRRKRSLWAWLTGQQLLAQAQASPGKVAPPAGVARPRPGVQPWPARQAFRSPPPSPPPAPQPPASQPSSAGDWELETRRHTGLGDGSRRR
jgi:hypothetical protein